MARPASQRYLSISIGFCVAIAVLLSTGVAQGWPCKCEAVGGTAVFIFDEETAEFTVSCDGQILEYSRDDEGDCNVAGRTLCVPDGGTAGWLAYYVNLNIFNSGGGVYSKLLSQGCLSCFSCAEEVASCCGDELRCMPNGGYGYYIEYYYRCALDDVTTMAGTKITDGTFSVSHEPVIESFKVAETENNDEYEVNISWKFPQSYADTRHIILTWLPMNDDPIQLTPNQCPGLDDQSTYSGSCNPLIITPDHNGDTGLSVLVNPLHRKNP